MLLDGRLEAWIAVSAMNVLDVDSLAGLDITEVSSTSMEERVMGVVLCSSGGFCIRHFTGGGIRQLTARRLEAAYTCFAVTTTYLLCWAVLGMIAVGAITAFP